MGTMYNHHNKTYSLTKVVNPFLLRNFGMPNLGDYCQALTTALPLFRRKCACPLDVFQSHIVKLLKHHLTARSLQLSKTSNLKEISMFLRRLKNIWKKINFRLDFWHRKSICVYVHICWGHVTPWLFGHSTHLLLNVIKGSKVHWMEKCPHWVQLRSGRLFLQERCWKVDM